MKPFASLAAAAASPYIPAADRVEVRDSRYHSNPSRMM